jgi:hypothetical protein
MIILFIDKAVFNYLYYKSFDHLLDQYIYFTLRSREIRSILATIPSDYQKSDELVQSITIEPQPNNYSNASKSQ